MFQRHFKEPVHQLIAGFIMPSAAAKPCRKCGVLVHSGGSYCTKHKREVKQRAETKRESSTARGYGYRWQQTSKGFLKKHPLCQCPECQEGKIRVVESTVVDHIIPHRGDMKLFWDPNNWQAMAKPCHDKKTASEDGGFGHHPKAGGVVKY